jgi:prepilin-type N-terminal cleavage/methylation domain-containing protein/prepilin-type processing-associated H-X9-DG protein
MKTNQQHKKNGFTLIELLVVIAIIAMLLSILLPALSAIKQQAQRVVCMANLSQWSMLFSMYAEDHDGYFFAGYYRYTDPNGVALQNSDSDTWPYAMQTYYEDPKLKFCPSARQDYGKKEYSGRSSWSIDADDIISGSYGLNGWVCDPPAKVVQTEGHNTRNNWRTIDVPGGNKIPLFLDAFWYTGQPEDNDLPGDNIDYPSGRDWANQPDNQMRRFCMDRHRGTLNVLFLDGSISAISPKALWRLKWNKAFDVAKPLPEWPQWMNGFKNPDK